MSWFKRKDSPQIPPVSNDAARNELLGSYSGNSTSPRPPASNRTISSANTYVASRDGDLYNSDNRAPSSGASTYTSSRDRYDRNNPVGDVYTRGLRDADADREQLFAGYNPERSRPPQQGSGRWPDDNRERGEDYNEDEDIEAIKKDTRGLKQDSLQSTRNALRLAREAEETARGTLLKLGDQSEKLANTERHLDIAKGHANRAEDRTGELKQLNRSIFRPVVVWNKDAKRAEQEAKMTARHQDERNEHERAMNDIRETQHRVGRAATYGMNSRGGGRDGPPEDDEEGIGGGGSGRYRSAEAQKARKEERKRYQFEATASDDELEDELDDNLDELADASKRLNAIALAAGQELDRQNPRIQRISEKTENLDLKIVKNTDKLKRFAR